MFVALNTALPPTCSDRDPIVPMPRGTFAVSECTTMTSSIGTPSTSETSAANIVSWPCPWGDVPDDTVTLPSSSTMQVPISEPMPVSSTYVARPMPSCLGSPLARRSACWARSSW